LIFYCVKDLICVCFVVLFFFTSLFSAVPGCGAVCESCAERRRGKERKGKDGLLCVRIAIKDLFLRASFSYFPQFRSVSGAWKVKLARDSRALSQRFGRSEVRLLFVA
jgi:hypothetical protein